MRCFASSSWSLAGASLENRLPNHRAPRSLGARAGWWVVGKCRREEIYKICAAKQRGGRTSPPVACRHYTGEVVTQCKRRM